MFHEKFTFPFIDFINSHFPNDDHFFLLACNVNEYHIYEKFQNKVFLGKGSLVYFFSSSYFKNAKKIIIHGLFNNNLIFFLYFNKRLLDKIYWVVWGGDLYNKHLNQNKNIKSKIFEIIRKKIIKDFGHIITCINGDYELIKLWYKSNAKFHYSFMYLSNLYKEINIEYEPIKRDYHNILVGNSSSSTNNHIEAFEKIKHLSNDKIFVPLSYGDLSYSNSVIKMGKYYFKNNFFPLTKFIGISDYYTFLASIDVAIFNHNRQEAIGNIITLLGFGKKVYIRNDITTFSFLKSLGIKTYSLDQDKELTFIDYETLKKNQEIIKKEFNVEKLKNDLHNIFNT
jgi:hypothetical protein